MGTLYYGDNLDILRRYLKDETVDLVYLDPPFNSAQTYNAFFHEKDGTDAASQIQAFEDTWHWNQESERTYQELVTQPSKVSEVMQAFRTFLGQNDMMAYLAMMAPRLIELRRVVKSTGSLYLHCDPTASHYLKLLLDAVFGANAFKAEIIWRRHNARSTEDCWPHVHDSILFYTKTDEFSFHQTKVLADERKLPHTLITGLDGRKYQTYELTGPGRTQDGESGRSWRGFAPSDMGRHWANTHTTMDEWANAGLIHFPKEGGFPRRRAAEPFDPASRSVMGVLISLQPPTREMVSEAVSTGFYEHKTNKQQYPRLQLRTVKELMEGKPIERPSTSAALDDTFKKAPKAKEKGHHQHDLPI